MKKLLLLLILPVLFAVTNAQSAEDDIAKLFNTTSTITSTSTTPNTGTMPTTTNKTTNSPTYGAAELNLENTSYVNNNNWTYTLSWTPVAWTAKVEISVKNNDLNEDFSTVNKVSASDGKSVVTLNNAWNYTVKLLPVDETTGLPVGTEIRKTIKVEAKVEANPTPANTMNPGNTMTPGDSTPVPHPDKPKVWVEDNLLFWIVLIAIISYMIYRFRKTN